jgi:hypothetical protein
MAARASYAFRNGKAQNSRCHTQILKQVYTKNCETASIAYIGKT